MCSSNANAASSMFRNGFGYTAKGLTSWTFKGATADAKYYFDYIVLGKQKQWGKLNANAPRFTFPVAFNTAYAVLGVRFSQGSTTTTNYYAYVYNLTNSYSELKVADEPAFAIAVGKG